MTVKELIEQLSEMDPDRIVIVSKDSEGNGYSPLCDVATAVYIAETTWSGEIGLEELTEEDIQQGYDEEDVKEGEPAVVLWPTN